MGSSPIRSSIKNKDRIRLISYSIFLVHQWCRTTGSTIKYPITFSTYFSFATAQTSWVSNTHTFENTSWVANISNSGFTWPTHRSTNIMVISIGK